MSKSVKKKRPEVHRVDIVPLEVRSAITHYARKTAGNCDIECDDVVQELMICAWLSSIRYDQEHPDCSYKSFLMSKLHFRALEIVQQDHLRKRRNAVAFGKAIPLLRTFTFDHSEEILDKIEIDRKLRRFPTKTQSILNFYALGFRQKEIGNMLHLNQGTVSRTINAVA